mgnify:FL=1
MAKATFDKTAQTEQPAKPAVATSSERLGESLSAVMDGEADDLALRRLIQESAGDPALAEKWERYHLARDMIHGRGRPLSSGFSARVAAAIDAETVPQATSVTGSRLPQSLVKFAVAATVAVVAVVTLQTGQNGSELPAPGLSATDFSQQYDAEMPAQVYLSGRESAVSLTPVDPEAQQRLRDYIESMSFDSDEAVRSEHIQSSPLYRLVNQLEADNP